MQTEQNCPTGSNAGVEGNGFVVRGVHSPPFSRRGGCAINKKIRFLSGADGVVSNFKQNMVRYADIYMEATRPFANHPVCAEDERIFLLRRSHPSLENGGE